MRRVGSDAWQQVKFLGSLRNRTSRNQCFSQTLQDSGTPNKPKRPDDGLNRPDPGPSKSAGVGPSPQKRPVDGYGILASSSLKEHFPDKHRVRISLRTPGERPVAHLEAANDRRPVELAR